MTLTTQERSLVSIYHSGTREATIAQFREALPFMDSADALAAQSAAEKLSAMSDEAFAALDLEGGGFL